MSKGLWGSPYFAPVAYFQRGNHSLDLRCTGNCFQRGPHYSTKMVALADPEVFQGRASLDSIQQRLSTYCVRGAGNTLVNKSPHPHRAYSHPGKGGEQISNCADTGCLSVEPKSESTDCGSNSDGQLPL